MRKYYVDYFVYRKRYYWFIIPSLVFYYDNDNYYDELKVGPSFGLTIRWLTFMAGFQVQIEQKD